MLISKKKTDKLLVEIYRLRRSDESMDIAMAAARRRILLAKKKIPEYSHASKGHAVSASSGLALGSVGLSVNNLFSGVSFGFFTAERLFLAVRTAMLAK